MPEKILVVDDDPGMRSLLEAYLGESGFAVETAVDGPAMWQALERGMPDAIVLDLMLPGEDGLSLARRLRSESNVPILMLSARGEEIDRVVGLELGADDYVAKPFHPDELAARVRSVLRRSSGATPEPPHKPAFRWPRLSLVSLSWSDVSGMLSTIPSSAIFQTEQKQRWAGAGLSC